MGGSISHGYCSTMVQLPTRRTTLAGPHCTYWPKANITLSRIASVLHNYYWSAAQISTRQTSRTELHYIWHPTMGGSKSPECCLIVMQPPTRRATRAGPHCM